MQSNKIHLGVNVDHVATLRQQRGTPYPAPVDAALRCEQAGADGITVHLREDRRHIQDADVYALKDQLRIPLNLEMACSPDIVAIALDVKPAEACLVPERREELTTEGGLDVMGRRQTVFDAVEHMQAAGIVVSLFIEPDPAQIECSAASGAKVIELHTGHFCERKGAAAADELERLKEGARIAHSCGLRVNAGHGIHLDNIGAILRIPYLHTLNIGHSIVARAVLVGMSAAVQEMQEAIARGPTP